MSIFAGMQYPKVNLSKLLQRILFHTNRYFSCVENKAEFITFITKLLRESQIEVHNCNGDADSTIVAKALDYPFKQPSRKVTVIADDIDIVIMLLHHWQPKQHGEIFFVQERYDKAWSIKEANSCKCYKNQSI